MQKNRNDLQDVDPVTLRSIWDIDLVHTYLRYEYDLARLRVIKLGCQNHENV